MESCGHSLEDFHEGGGRKRRVGCGRLFLWQDRFQAGRIPGPAGEFDRDAPRRGRLRGLRRAFWRLPASGLRPRPIRQALPHHCWRLRRFVRIGRGRVSRLLRAWPRRNDSSPGAALSPGSGLRREWGAGGLQARFRPGSARRRSEQPLRPPGSPSAPRRL